MVDSVDAARCARFVAWANAVVLGAVSPDTAAERIAGSTFARVDGLPGGDDQTLPVALARLRGVGVTGVRLLLPVSGDPVGLPPPGAFATAAMARGAGAVLEGAQPRGLVPDAAGERWVVVGVDDDLQRPGPGLPTLAESDRDLAVALREVTELLVRLDVARLDVGDQDALEQLRAGGFDGEGLAPGYPERAFGVLLRARRLRAVVELAARGDGSAVSAAEARARADALRPLARAARYAEMAAHNSVLEPWAASTR